MTDKKNVEEANETTPQSFLNELREFALVVGEECPEGHRRDPGSGRCLPIGSTDHTAFTRSLNDDQGDEWRGLVDKTNETFDTASQKEVALDADEMDEPESCAEGTTFSFVQRQCVSLEEAERENSDEFAMTEEGEYVETEEAAAPGQGGHKEITEIDPEGRRDTVNFRCPPNQFFDFKRRECIPLNKDTVMASENASLSDEEKQELARHLHGKVAMTSPDPLDGHTHLVTVDAEGNGKTSIAGYREDAHSHDVSGYVVQDEKVGEYVSRHFGHAVPQEVYEYGDDDTAEAVPAMAEEAETETAAPITTKQRKGLSDSSFGVPGKRKFPLDTCARVRNAMARFNQAKGLTSGEKATLRRKILARAKACGIEVKNFAKANTAEEFAAVFAELMEPFRKATEDRMADYKAESEDMKKKGPCPPGMEWDAKTKRCTKMRGFYEAIKDQANHSEIIAKQPAGRRDTVNHTCPPGHLFDYKNRKCIPMDTSTNPGQPGDTTKAAEEDAAKRDLSPLPEGKPARLPQDCPKGTIWDGDLRKCKPLDSRKKTKSSEEEEAQAPANGPGNKGGPGCPEGQFMNPVTKKCQPRKGAFKGKSGEEDADAKPGNREGLTQPPAGKVQHQSDCPEGTAWDAKNKICRPLDSMEKSRPDGASPQSPKDTASVESVVENMSLAKLISHLDEIIREDLAEGRKEKAKVAAKELPNEAFPPSLVGSTRRSLMHHTPEVTDPYDTETVDVARLRNALARVSKVDGYAEKAVEDARDHLVFHAREIVSRRLGKD